MKNINKILIEFKATRPKTGTKLKFPIEVTIIGAEERNYSGFKKFTVYITQLKVHHLTLNLFLRYSEMK